MLPQHPKLLLFVLELLWREAAVCMLVCEGGLAVGRNGWRQWAAVQARCPWTRRHTSNSVEATIIAQHPSMLATPTLSCAASAPVCPPL